MTESDNNAKLNRNLTVKLVSSLTDKFRVPPYQRGYRWERRQVKQLLDDIEKSEKDPYYLQPIVVAPGASGWFDLVDGQQRLTTLMLIYKMLHQKKLQYSILGEANPLNSLNLKSPYDLTYETRSDKTSAFLNDLDTKSLPDIFEVARHTPDTLYMWHACDEILHWFGNNFVRMQSIATALAERVKIIWYELEESIDCWEKFADLNVGKIPLTNSELIKALFMRDDGKNTISEHDKSVIVDQWDSIERDLNNEMFWDFLTNRPINAYDTKIDLLFDILAEKRPDEKDDFYTFFEFEKRYGGASSSLGKEVWNDIYLQYLRLRDWYDDPTNELYHKIGYLVSIDDKDKVLAELFEISKQLTHDKFVAELDSRIRKSIILPLKNSKDDREDADARIRLCQLSYGVNNALIERILTLFNVMTIQNLSDKTQRYSFHHHKNVGGGWSLEHIHAQKSDLLNTEEQWKKWMELHQKSLMRFKDSLILNNATIETLNEVDKLNDEMLNFINGESRSRTQITFNRISRRFAEIVVSKDERTTATYKDEMANMALLSKDDNAMLSNSVFDVKRGLIMHAITKSFVPICTQHVFMKAYTPQGENQIFFWGKNDRDAYIDQMEVVLKSYLPKGYETEKELHEKSKTKKEEK
ncbi:MAG: DUF262 domain-containing protein [Bacteroides sp.]|nr:DUF262 domain-containing protein [Bacteroides sp.]